MPLLKCAACPAEAHFKTYMMALHAGWIYAMQSPFGQIGDDGCPVHREEILQGIREDI